MKPNTHALFALLVASLLMTAAVTLTLTLTLTCTVGSASATELAVGGRGGYPTIQKAVNAASPGDTVIVASGTYIENVVVDKPLIIRSAQGAATTVVQAAVASKDVFLLTGTNIRVEGFTLVGMMGSSGVTLDHAAQCVVTNNVAYGHIRGVYLHSTTASEVSHNNVSNNGYGVYLDGSSSNTLADNVAVYEKGFSIYLGDGIFMNGASRNVITRNVLNSNHMFGISLWNSAENAIVGNTISGNEQFGVRLRNSNNNTLALNTISATVQDGIYIGYSSGNKIYLNTFANNPNHVSNPQGNVFTSPQKLAYTYNGSEYVGYMGNYYADYRGTDRDGNGIGDVPYPLGDSAPLMKPAGQYRGIGVPTPTPTPTPTPVSTVASLPAAHDSSENQSNQNTNNKSAIPGFGVELAILGIMLTALIAVRRKRLK